MTLVVEPIVRTSSDDSTLGRSAQYGLSAVSLQLAAAVKTARAAW